LLQFKKENLRTQKVFVGMGLTIPAYDKFKGHDGNAERCRIMLEGLGSTESVLKQQGVDDLQRIARGCNCGKCLTGFLSPRMSHVLLFQTEMGYDMMNDVGEISGPEWIDLHGEKLGYLPSRLRSNLKTNKSMRQGLVNLWERVETCLKNGSVPSESNVLEAVDKC
jgi:hypothetical protein